MKKILFATLFAAGASAMMVSCDTKAYDANPKTDLSNTKNPLDPNSGVKIQPGSVVARRDYTDSMLFSPAETITDTDGARIMYAYGYNSITKTHDGRNLRIVIDKDMYQGPKLYKIGEEAFGFSFLYQIYDEKEQIYKYYMAVGNGGNGKGVIHFDIKGDEGGNFRGIFSGTAYRYYRENYSFDENEKVTFTDGEFYFLKK